jgi:hypothetical protein
MGLPVVVVLTVVPRCHYVCSENRPVEVVDESGVR